MFHEVFLVILPIFALIGIGYVAAQSGFLPKDMGDVLGKFCLRIVIPALMIRTMSTADLSGVSPWHIWGAYYGGIVVAASAGALLVRYFFQREARAAVVAGLSASFSNSALIGIPLVTSILGPDAIVPLSLIISIHTSFMTVGSVFFMERAVVIDGYTEAPPAGKMFQSVLKSLLSNPVIIGILIGLLLNFSGIGLPSFAASVINPVASAASPVALIAVGLSMVSYGIRGNVKIGFCLSLIKMGLFPGVVLLLSTFVFALPPLWVAVATINASCPTGVFTYLMATQFGTGHAMSTNSITLTTAIAVVVVSFWTWVLVYVQIIPDQFAF